MLPSCCFWFGVLPRDGCAAFGKNAIHNSAQSSSQARREAWKGGIAYPKGGCTILLMGTWGAKLLQSHSPLWGKSYTLVTHCKGKSCGNRLLSARKHTCSISAVSVCVSLLIASVLQASA